MRPTVNETLVNTPIFSSPINNLHLLIKNIAEGKIVLPNICPKCMNQFYFDSVLNLEQKGHRVFVSQFINFEQKQSKEFFTKCICSALNAGSAVILIGVTKQHKIKGATLDKEHIYQLEPAIMKIRRQFIFPQEQQNERIQISFHQIKHSLQNNKIKESFMQKCSIGIIKVYVHTQYANKGYFMISQNKKNGIKTYKMWKDPESQLDQTESYKIIHQASKRPKIKNLHGSIKCIERKVQYQITQTKNKKEQQYEKNPIHYYRFIIIFDNRSKIIQDFLNQIKGVYYISPIYVTKPQRFISYLEVSQEQNLKQIALQLNPQQKELVVLKVTKKLTTISTHYFSMAYNLLFPKYYQIYRKKLQVSQQILKGNKNIKLSHYFCFDSQEESIYAFKYLEALDIWTKFPD